MFVEKYLNLGIMIIIGTDESVRINERNIIAIKLDKFSGKVTAESSVENETFEVTASSPILGERLYVALSKCIAQGKLFCDIRKFL